MIERQSRINQIEITENGTVQIRIALLLLEDGVQLFREWHRTSFPPGIGVDAQISVVNAHLKQMGKPVLDKGDISKLKPVIKLAHTPEAVAAYQEALKKAAESV